MGKDTLVELTDDEGEQDAPSTPPTTWWDTYLRNGLGGLSPTASATLELDARFIAETCIVDPEDIDCWPESRQRTGIVVGAVQSGKTASMLGISALLLDRGLDFLIILAGTRIALWKQTYERFLEQLDGSEPENQGDRWTRRVLVPNPYAFLRGEERTPPSSYMASAGLALTRALQERKPTILIVPKNEQHLLAVSREIEKRVKKTAPQISRPLHMVVLDDEADDASVLDAGERKTIPRRIEMLWSGNSSGTTMVDNLYATYVAYTATPQANFLQESQNPLSPRDFRAALRAPYKEGVAGVPRTPTFNEPLGLSRYYCGGEFFYEELRGAAGDPVVSLNFPDTNASGDDGEHARRVRLASDRLVVEGLRSFLVAAAIRELTHVRQGGFMIRDAIEGVEPGQVERMPGPHCMLIHPSARQAVHLGEARRLVTLASGLDPDTPDVESELDPDELAFDVEGLRTWLTSDPPAWSRWLREYRNTVDQIRLLPGGAERTVPSDDEWPLLQRTLEQDILPYVRIRIINSDPETDDRPRFDPVSLPGGKLGAPPDVLTIFVSGNVMSRGITLEGLCTSVFTRQADEPAADTQMQMQRWFGYRGSHAHLCRLFCFDDQLELFRTYHEHDLNIRKEILAGMDRNEHTAFPHIILQGPRSLATAKVPTTRLPLHPGANPSVKLVETGQYAEDNSNLLADLLDEGEWSELRPGGSLRGLVRNETATLVEVAAMLDRFRYSHHDPATRFDERYTRWLALEEHLGLLPNERPLFRPPGILHSEPAVDVRGCPYSIAAYLRLWNAALQRPRCDGLFPLDASTIPWALAQPMMRAPETYVALRFGGMGSSMWPRLAGHGVQAMRRGLDSEHPPILSTLWGSRRPSAEYHGDQLLDYHFHNLTPPRLLGGPMWRPRGHPALLLFHVVRVGDVDAITVGLSLPHGGPDQFAAIPGKDAMPCP